MKSNLIRISVCSPFTKLTPEQHNASPKIGAVVVAV